MNEQNKIDQLISLLAHITASLVSLGGFHVFLGTDEMTNNIFKLAEYITQRVQQIFRE